MYGGNPSLMSVPVMDKTKHKVLSIEKIDAPPILKQDLPKQKNKKAPERRFFWY